MPTYTWQPNSHQNSYQQDQGTRHKPVTHCLTTQLAIFLFQGVGTNFYCRQLIHQGFVLLIDAENVRSSAPYRGELLLNCSFLALKGLDTAI